MIRLRRLRGARGRQRGACVPVADAVRRLDGVHRLDFTELASQPCDVLVQGVLVHHRALRPAHPDQLPPADDRAGPGDQGAEQPELRRGERRGPRTGPEGVGRRVQAQLAGRGRRRDGGAPEQGSQSSGEFGEVERLGEVVIAAGGEAGQPVRHGMAGGEEQHRDGHPAGPQRLAQVATVGVGQPDVHHQGVEAVLGDAKRAGRVRGGRHGEAFLPQAAGHDVPQRRIVFDDEQARRCHLCSLPLRPNVVRRPATVEPARRSLLNRSTAVSRSEGSGQPKARCSSRSASAGLRASTGPCR